MHLAGWKHWIHASFIPIQHSLVSAVSNSLNLLAEGALQAVQKHIEILFFPAACQYINASNTLLPGWRWHLGPCSGCGSNILQKTVALLFENVTDLMKSNLLRQAGGVNYSTKFLCDIRSRKRVTGLVPAGTTTGSGLKSFTSWSTAEVRVPGKLGKMLVMGPCNCLAVENMVNKCPSHLQGSILLSWHSLLCCQDSQARGWRAQIPLSGFALLMTKLLLSSLFADSVPRPCLCLISSSLCNSAITTKSSLSLLGINCCCHQLLLVNITWSPLCIALS